MKNHASDNDPVAKKKAVARTAIILAVVFGGMITLMIAGMLAFDIYGEKKTEALSSRPPTDAADR